MPKHEMTGPPLQWVLQTVLLAVAIGIPQSVVAGVALLCSVGLAMAFEISSENQGAQTGWRRQFRALVAMAMAIIGYLLTRISAQLSLHLVGVSFLLVGLGGMLSGFPLPLTRLCSNPSSGRQNFVSLVVPTLLAAILLFRCVTIDGWSERELALLAVVSLYSLVLCGVRSYGAAQVTRVSMAVHAILGHAGIVCVLAGWETQFPDRAWNATSNFLPSAMVFWWLLAIETLACWIWWRCDLSVREPENSTLRGLPSRSAHVAGWLALLNVAGMLPLPGGVWRFHLVASLLLPQAQSVVTNLREPHPGFITLALGYACALLTLAIGFLHPGRDTSKRHVRTA